MRRYEKGHPKLLNAWAFYDWANSVYSLVIATAIFPLYYDSLFSSLGRDSLQIFGILVDKTSFISYIMAVGFLVVVLISPILSGVADYLGNKKHFLRFFCYLGSFCCMGLYFFSIDESNLLVSSLLYIGALVGFWGSIVFYNSYLPEIAYPNQQDRISAKAFSFGYFGSVILLIVILAVLMQVDDSHKLQVMKISFISVGLWWFGFSHITYRKLPPVQIKGKMTLDAFTKGFNELNQVRKKIIKNPYLFKYLTAFSVFNMAVQTVMAIAVYFGTTAINWESENEKRSGLIVSVLIIQLVAILGAWVISKGSEKFGNIKTLIVVNIFWLIICVFAYYTYEPIEFYSIAAAVGFVMGGIQSLSRSTYSKLIPQKEKDTTSFFSFYDVTEKLGIVIGMMLYGYLNDLTGNIRIPIILLTSFFALGVFLLGRIQLKKND